MRARRESDHENESMSFPRWRWSKRIWDGAANSINAIHAFHVTHDSGNSPVRDSIDFPTVTAFLRYSTPTGTAPLEAQSHFPVVVDYSHAIRDASRQKHLISMLKCIFSVCPTCGISERPYVFMAPPHQPFRLASGAVLLPLYWPVLLKRSCSWLLITPYNNFTFQNFVHSTSFASSSSATLE